MSDNSQHKVNQSMESSFLSSIQDHGSDHLPNHPVTHAHNHYHGWSTPVFENNLELFPGAKESSIDLGIFGSIDNHGIFAVVKQTNAFNNNIVDAFDGTILAPGNIKHEGFDLKATDGVSLKNTAPDVGDISAIYNTSGRGGGG